ncbi:MAG: hypothetical protein NUV80_06520 [Candidatus Berkelbacteria bacterium]|nr:hypothetical protein [Candidatus Berkelbacteria bacterium]
MMQLTKKYEMKNMGLMMNDRPPPTTPEGHKAAWYRKHKMSFHWAYYMIFRKFPDDAYIYFTP